MMTSNDGDEDDRDPKSGGGDCGKSTKGGGKGGRPRGRQVDGEAARRGRARLGLTQEELEVVSGLTVRTIQAAEASRRVAEASLKVLAQSLGMSADALVMPEPEQLRAALLNVGRAPGPPPTGWISRREHFNRVSERLLQGGPGAVCCITGAPGVGKTALALHIAHELAPRFKHGVAWVSCTRSFAPARADVAQADLANALGFSARLPRVEDVGREAFDSIFQRLFWKTGRLLILDDATCTAFTSRFIPRSLDVPVILTSNLRHVADEFPEPIVIGGLPDERSHELLAGSVGYQRLEQDPVGVHKLIEFLGGNTRALLVAAALLKRSRYLMPGELVQMVLDTPEELSDLFEIEGCEDPAERRHFSYVASLAQVERHVSMEAWQLFGNLGALGDAAFPVSWAVPVGGLSRRTTIAALGELENTFMIRDVPCAGASEPLVQLERHLSSYARWIARERLAGASERMLDHATAVAHTTHDMVPDVRARLLGPIRDLLAGCLDRLRQHTDLDLTGRVRLTPADREGLGTALSEPRLASMLWALGDWTLAALPQQLEGWLVSAHASAIAAGDQLARGQMALLLGRYWFSVHVDFALAAMWADEAAAGFLECAENHWAATASGEAARVLTAMGRIPEAIERFRRSLDIAPAANNPARARIANNLGITLTRLPKPQWSEAMNLLQMATDLADDEPTRDVVSLNLALVHVAADELLEWDTAPVAAERLLRQAVPGSLLAVWLDGIAEVLDIDLDPADFGCEVDLHVTTQRGTDSVLWQLGEMAYYLRLLREAEVRGEQCPTTAGGLSIANVATALRLADHTLLGLLFPLRPMARAFAPSFVDAARTLAHATFGEGHPVREELDGLWGTLEAAAPRSGSTDALGAVDEPA